MAQFSPDADANYTTVKKHMNAPTTTAFNNGIEYPSQVPPPATLGNTTPGVSGRQHEIWLETFVMYICGAATDTNVSANALAAAIKAADYACQLDGNRSTIAAGAAVGTWVVGNMGA